MRYVDVRSLGFDGLTLQPSHTYTYTGPKKEILGRDKEKITTNSPTSSILDTTCVNKIRPFGVPKKECQMNAGRLVDGVYYAADDPVNE